MHDAFEQFIGVQTDMRSRPLSKIIREEAWEETLLKMDREDLGYMQESVRLTTAKLVARGVKTEVDLVMRTNSDPSEGKKVN